MVERNRCLDRTLQRNRNDAVPCHPCHASAPLFYGFCPHRRLAVVEVAPARRRLTRQPLIPERGSSSRGDLRSPKARSLELPPDLLCERPCLGTRIDHDTGCEAAGSCVAQFCHRSVIIRLDRREPTCTQRTRSGQSVTPIRHRSRRLLNDLCRGTESTRYPPVDQLRPFPWRNEILKELSVTWSSLACRAPCIGPQQVREQARNRPHVDLRGCHLHPDVRPPGLDTPGTR